MCSFKHVISWWERVNGAVPNSPSSYSVRMILLWNRIPWPWLAAKWCPGYFLLSNVLAYPRLIFLLISSWPFFLSLMFWSLCSFCASLLRFMPNSHMLDLPQQIVTMQILLPIQILLLDTPVMASTRVVELTLPSGLNLLSTPLLPSLHSWDLNHLCSPK